MNFELIEPLRELFKDQVRNLASFLKLPDSVVNKEVFPGPGFAIRVDGEVTSEKVGITMANLSILKNGKARAIRFSTLEAICKALDCQPGDILEYKTG
jgi:DNA-binding Xre family transcriptional regulator